MKPKRAQGLADAAKAIQAKKAPNKQATKPKKAVGVTPTPEQMKKSSFERDFVTHTETATKAVADRNRDSFIVQRWIEDDKEEGILFPEPAKRFIADCLTLWQKVPQRSITAKYGQHIASQAGNDDQAGMDPLDEINALRAHLGPYKKHMWPVFENVVRWNLPAGVAGSDFAKNPAGSVQTAKLFTSMVAIELSEKLRY